MNQVTTQNKDDLSYINNLKDLRREIARVKLILRQQEEELKTRGNMFWKEAIGATANSVIGMIVKPGVSLNIVRLLKNGIGFAINVKRSQKGVDEIISNLKRIAIYATLSRMLLFLGKRNKKLQTVSAA